MTFIAAHFVEKHKSGQRRSYLHCKIDSWGSHKQERDKKKETAQSKEEENKLNQVPGQAFRRSQAIIWLMMMMFNFVWAEALINLKRQHKIGLGGCDVIFGCEPLKLCDQALRTLSSTSLSWMSLTIFMISPQFPKT